MGGCALVVSWSCLRKLRRSWDGNLLQWRSKLSAIVVEEGFSSLVLLLLQTHYEAWIACYAGYCGWPSCWRGLAPPSQMASLMLLLLGSATGSTDHGAVS